MYRNSRPTFHKWILGGYHGRFIPEEGLGSECSTTNTAKLDNSRCTWNVKELGAEGLYVTSSPHTARLYASAIWAQQQQQQPQQDITTTATQGAQIASSPVSLLERGSSSSSSSSSVRISGLGSVRIFKVHYDAAARWYEPLPVQVDRQWERFSERRGDAGGGGEGGRRSECLGSTPASPEQEENPPPPQDSFHHDDHPGVLINALEIPAMIAGAEEVATALSRTQEERQQSERDWSFLTDTRTVPSQYKVPIKMLPHLNLESIECYKDTASLAKVLDEPPEDPPEGGHDDDHVVVDRVATGSVTIPKKYLGPPREQSSYQGGIVGEKKDPFELILRTEPDGDCFFSSISYFTKRSAEERYRCREQAREGNDSKPIFPCSKGGLGSPTLAAGDPQSRTTEKVRRDIATYLARHVFGRNCPEEVTPKDTPLMHLPKAAEFKERWDLVTLFGENIHFLKPTLNQYVVEMVHAYPNRHLTQSGAVAWGDAELLGPSVADIYGRDLLVFPTPTEPAKLGQFHQSGGSFIPTQSYLTRSSQDALKRDMRCTSNINEEGKEEQRRKFSSSSGGSMKVTKATENTFKLPIELFFDPRRMHFDACTWRGPFCSS